MLHRESPYDNARRAALLSGRVIEAAPLHAEHQALDKKFRAPTVCFALDRANPGESSHPLPFGFRSV
jgi:hypothetical protein